MSGPLTEIQQGAGEAVADGVIQQRVLQPNRKAMETSTAVDISQGQRAEGVLMPGAAVQAPTELVARLQQGGETEAARPQHGADGPVGGGQAGGADLEPYLVPACAAWFRWDALAEVEEAHFKDFLGLEAGNAERYRLYRNAIINKYRWNPLLASLPARTWGGGADPGSLCWCLLRVAPRNDCARPRPGCCREDTSRELTFTEARRALVGDVNLLRRIWKFLHSWQLINYLARRSPLLQGALARPAGSAGEPDTPLGSREGARMLLLAGTWRAA